MELLDKRYILGPSVGMGGTGTVYLATDVRLSRKVAIKDLGKVENSAHFFSHIQPLQYLQIPQLPRFYDAFVENQKGYVVMEYVEGRNLATILQEGKTYSLTETLHMGIQIGQILQAMHEQNPVLIYRDLKPENLMMTEGGIKLIDMGSVAVSYLGYVQEKVLRGTRCYASPEQLSGKRVDIRSDLYSLGVVLTVLFYGPKVLGGHREKLKYGVRDEREKEFCRILLKATQPDPDQRYINARQMIADMKKVMDSEDQAEKDSWLLKFVRRWLRTFILNRKKRAKLSHLFEINKKPEGKWVQDLSIWCRGR